MVILGRADKPVYLSIHDEDVQIKDASDLWGADTFEAQKALMADDTGTSVLTIGPAGENLSRIAVILNETGSAAGQGGFGGVMGSKNLKAIAVRGTGAVSMAKPDEFLELISWVKKRGEWSKGGGQSAMRDPLVGNKKIKTDMVEKHRKRFTGCFLCPYQCYGYYSIPRIGQGAAICASWWWDKPHYYGPYPGQNTEAVWEAQLIAQRLGINQFELIGMIGFMRAALREGVLTGKDLGLPLCERFGGKATDHEFLSALLYGIADGTSPFSKGMARAAEDFVKAAGNEEAIKKIYETIFPLWGQRGHFYEYLGLALHVATDTRDTGDSSDEYLAFGPGMDIGSDSYFVLGPGTDTGALTVAEHFGVPGGWATYLSGKEIYEGIERLTFWVSCNHNLKNSLPLCNWASMPSCFFDPPEMDVRIFEAKIYSAVTGIGTSVEEMWQTGERIANLKRAVMVKREGRTREEETFPDSFFETQWDTGNLFGGTAQLDRDKFEALKDRYYRLCGWDVKTGRPTRLKLEELGLKDVADELES
jgi:aldehyde:ferredoxin oxidoreductase